MKRKNPYSSVDVNLISIESLARQHAGQPAVAGVDVARGELVMCLVWPDRTFERPWSVASPGQIRLAVSKLAELNASCPVTVAMESSGTYGDCFRQALFDAGLAVHRVSAKAVKDDSEGFDGVPSSHDGKDAAIIGTLCVNGRSSAWRWTGAAETPNDECRMQNEDQARRYWVRRLDTAQRIKQVWCGKLEAMGLNLTERSSGMYKGKLKLSKRGQRLARKWLYFSALRWMREPSVKIWLENKKRRDGGKGSKAATGIMRKLAAAAWHAGQGEVFDPKRLFPGSRVVAGY